MIDKIKIIIKKLLEWLSYLECIISAYWTASAHKRLKRVQWRLPPQPEHFDHNIDLYWQWKASRNPMWIERGIYSNLVLKEGSILELACGDGFNARNFYSLKSKNVVAVDFDYSAIKTARRFHGASNIKYVLADIRIKIPEGQFDNIIWDAALEHFTKEEIGYIIKNIRSRITKTGVLSGHTVVENLDGRKSLSHHEYEFKNKEDLARFLTPYFKNVIVFETKYPTRHNLYFWASDGPLPFMQDWPGFLIIQKK